VLAKRFPSALLRHIRLDDIKLPASFAARALLDIIGMIFPMIPGDPCIEF
jgi:TRAP-type mannitol/chloroaromatic compound transport system permease small subunit